MTKLLLALSVLASLSAPAAAGRLDAEPTIENNPAQVEQVPAAQANLEGARAVQAPESGESRAAADDPFNHGDLFGANSR